LSQPKLEQKRQLQLQLRLTQPPADNLISLAATFEARVAAKQRAAAAAAATARATG